MTAWNSSSTVKPRLAQFDAVELVMSEARRATTAHPARPPRDTALDTAKDQVGRLLVIERAGGERLTGTAVASQLGISPRRAQELLKELRSEGAQPDIETESAV